MEKTPWEGWVILELMGHRRLAGYLREEAIGGTSFLRIDVPGVEGNVATQYYTGSAVYCITPTTAAIAKKVALAAVPAPVTAWELREPPALAAATAARADEDEDDIPY